MARSGIAGLRGVGEAHQLLAEAGGQLLVAVPLSEL